jgi:NDP-sugar pyrophosphorylase family protein
LTRGTSLKVLILAAGSGKRSRHLTQDTPKVIYPINKSNSSTLSKLMKSLEQINFSDITIVGGFQFDKLKSAADSFKMKLGPVNLINANPECQKGPIYSFLSAKKSFENESHFIVFPGDTVFQADFFKFIQKLDFDLTSNTIHLFYSQLSHIPSKKSICLDMKPNTGKMSRDIIKNIMLAEKWDSGFKIKPEKYPILIPAVILPNSIFKYAEQQAKNGNTKLISAIEAFVKDIANINSCYAYRFQNNKIESIFHDFDFPDDLKYLSSIK